MRMKQDGTTSSHAQKNDYSYRTIHDEPARPRSDHKTAVTKENSDHVSTKHHQTTNNPRIKDPKAKDPRAKNRLRDTSALPMEEGERLQTKTPKGKEKKSSLHRDTVPTSAKKNDPPTIPPLRSSILLSGTDREVPSESESVINNSKQVKPAKVSFEFQRKDTRKKRPDQNSSAAANSRGSPVLSENDLEVPTDPKPIRCHPKVRKNINGNFYYYPNEPHPSLEFPPLYFVLRGFPVLREKIRSLYSWRWASSYPLQRRVAFSRYLQYVKIHLTYGEILMSIPLAILAIVCCYQTWIEPNVRGTGRISRGAVVAALLFAQKNSYITMVIGVPFDRAVAYHKISGYLAVVTGVLHAIAYVLDQPATEKRFLQGQKSPGGFGGHFEHNKPPMPTVEQTQVHTNVTGSTSPAASAPFQLDQVSWWEDFVEGPMNTSGTMILLFLFAMFLTSLPMIRNRIFELFYYTHLILLLGVIGGAAVHTGIMVPVTVLATTGVDFFIRKVLMARFRYPKAATLKVISESVVEISFPKVADFDYNPGQYVYIAVPEISSFEWHPFSLSSAPHQSKVTLHIRDAGNWTHALYELAQKKSEISILLEGPYGNFCVDVMNEKRYKVVLLLSGGIGLTPMQSLFSNLIHEHGSGVREMKKLSFVWIQRDPELMVKSAVADTSAELRRSRQSMAMLNDWNAASIVSDDDDEVSLASRILSAIPRSIETDAQLEALYGSADLLSDIDSNVEDDASESTIFYQDEPELARQEDPALLVDVVNIEIYLTDNKVNNKVEHLVPGVKKGRPNIPTLFRKLREDAIRLGENRVAVCVCGPKRIADLSRKACIQLSDKMVCFDYHEEAFG